MARQSACATFTELCCTHSGEALLWYAGSLRWLCGPSIPTIRCLCLVNVYASCPCFGFTCAPATKSIAEVTPPRGVFARSG